MIPSRSKTYRPGLVNKSARWWPTPPKPTGGTVEWEPKEAEIKWLATGKGVRKKSTETHMLCVGGPYHNERVLYNMKKKTGREKVKLIIATLPDVFVCPPYRGRYELDKTNEDPKEHRYVWC